MSDNSVGKKFVEEEHLRYFLEAYAKVTGFSMSIVSGGESPDFICARPSGETVGVELARSPHDYHGAVWDRIWTDSTMSAHDLFDAINQIVETKTLKRQSVHWRTPNNTILVVELLDYKFDSLFWIKESFAKDYADAGFVEIWLADFSTLEAYGEARLIGLYPPNIWGIRRQPMLEGKPYG
jgi:hypothetical protein